MTEFIPDILIGAAISLVFLLIQQYYENKAKEREKAFMQNHF